MNTQDIINKKMIHRKLEETYGDLRSEEFEKTIARYIFDYIENPLLGRYRDNEFKADIIKGISKDIMREPKTNLAGSEVQDVFLETIWPHYKGSDQGYNPVYSDDQECFVCWQIQKALHNVIGKKYFLVTDNKTNIIPKECVFETKAAAIKYANRVWESIPEKSQSWDFVVYKGYIYSIGDPETMVIGTAHNYIKDYWMEYMERNQS